jgi:uncharacterized cupin superfamily protein
MGIYTKLEVFYSATLFGRHHFIVRRSSTHKGVRPMKSLFTPALIISTLALTFSLSSIADDSAQITVIDSATPTKALMAKPGTYLGETFTFEQQHSGDTKVQIGVWEAGMGKLTLDNFPFTEYVLMISGSVIVTEKNGTSKTFKAGDTFVIPKGWTGIWDVQERMKKQIVRIGNTKQ